MFPLIKRYSSRQEQSDTQVEIHGEKVEVMLKGQKIVGPFDCKINASLSRALSARSFFNR